MGASAPFPKEQFMDPITPRSPDREISRESDIVVGFTLKEMFLDIRTHLGKLEGLLENKADKADVDNHEARINHFEKQEEAWQANFQEYKTVREMVRSHEIQLQRQDAVKANNKSNWALLVSGAGFISALVGILTRI